MSDLEPKLKAMIFGVPTLLFVLAGIAGKTAGEMPISWEGVLLLAPLGFGIGWIIVNVYHVSEQV